MADPQAKTAVNPYAAPQAAVGDAPEQTQPVELFSVSGRIGRVRYIAYLLGLYILFAIFTVLASMVAGAFGQVLWLGYMVLVFMLTIQRCHDFNTTGWLSILSLVPLVNLIFWFIPGTDGSNRYGPRTPPNSTGAIVMVWILPAIAVIGIIAAVAIPAYQTYAKRAAEAQQRR